MPETETEKLARETKEASDKEAAEAKAKADKEAADNANKDDDDDDDKPLGEKGKAALVREREARKKLEAEQRETAKRLKAFEDKELSETEKAKKEKDEATEANKSATEKLRKANLMLALGEEGLIGAKAKAAVRLLDDVQFDETTDEPKNLSDALKAAKAEYGEEMFQGATPAKDKKSGKTDAGGGSEDRDGPALTADELKAAKASGMTADEYRMYRDNPGAPLAAPKDDKSKEETDK